jgi:hypothetical protein
MKNEFFLIFTVALCQDVLATDKPALPFSCELIKEKTVRESCVADRKEKAQALSDSQIEKAKIDKAADEERQKVTEFVNKAKEELTRNYKDPRSAQYSDLIVAENSAHKALCGFVNAKNSYGAYTGTKRFYISYWKNSNSIPTDIWYEGDSTKGAKESDIPALLEARRKMIEVEAKIAEQNCTAGVGYSLIKIPE